VATPDWGIASMMHRNREPCTNAIGVLLITYLPALTTFLPGLVR